MRSYNDYAIATFLRAEFGRLPSSAGGRLLDLGCGARPYEALYREHFEQRVAGDFEVRSANLDVRLDARALPFNDGTFDVVLFSEVIEHVEDSQETLTEISRVLKPGGILLITWPFNYMMHERPNDYVRYTEYGMARALERHGLRLEALVRRGSAFAVGLLILEFLVGGLLTSLSRLPIIGGLFGPVRKTVMYLGFQLPWQFYFGIRGTAGCTYHSMPGEGLSGLYGHTFHWTVGYCGRARKGG